MIKDTGYKLPTKILSFGVMHIFLKYYWYRDGSLYHEVPYNTQENFFALVSDTLQS